MVRLNHTEIQVQMDYLNVPQSSNQGGTEEVKGNKVYRLVAISLGLLFVLQAALNISLRLATSQSSELHGPDGNDTDATCENTVQEIEKLQKKITTIDNYGQRGWQYSLSSLYYISSATQSWSNSQADCQRRGADLVVINSREEQEFVVKFNMRIWIGLQKKDNTWKWVDGSLLTKSYWAPNEPNNYEGAIEDCGQLLHNDIDSWNDAQCFERHHWICEKSV